MVVRRLVDRVIADAQKRVKPSTLKKYRRAAAVINREIGETPIQELTAVLAWGLLDEIRHKPAAANHIHTILCLVGRHSVQAGLLDHNPMADIRRFQQRPRDRYLTDKEFDRIRRNSQAPLPLIMDLCYLTGQRISDVLQINQEDITDSGGIGFKQQKTGIRVIIESPSLARTVRYARRRANGSDYLVADRLGHPLNYLACYRLWRAACGRAGIEDANLHDLRAKSVTDADRQGHDPTALAGHTNSAQTRRYLRGRTAKVVTGPDRENEGK